MNQFKQVSKAFGSIKLLPKKLQSKTRFLQGASIFVALLDILGLGSMVPVLVLAIDHNFIEKSSKLRSIYYLLDFDNESHFLLFLIVVIFVFFVVKSIVAFWVQKQIGRLADSICLSLSSRSFEQSFNDFTYVHRSSDSLSFTDYLMFNSFYFVSGVFIPCMVLISEIGVVVFMVLLFCAYKPIMFLPLVFFLLFSVSAVMVYFKQKNQKLGKEIGELREKNIAALQYGVQGFLDIKNYRAQNFFKKQFMKTYEPYVHKGTQSNIIQLIPARIMEIITLVGIIGLVLYAYFISNNIGEARAIAVMFVIAVFRLLPAANKIMLASIKIKLNGYTIDKINTEKQKTPTKTKALPETLALNPLIYGYENNLVEKGEIELKKGSIVGLAGASGTGKTTLLHALQGYVPSNIKINNSIELSEIEENVSYLGQSHFVFEGNIGQNVAMKETFSEGEQKEIIRALESAHFDLDNIGLNYEVLANGENLSEGQKQRLCIARLTFANKDILLLDEPTSSLDSENEQGIIELIKKMALANKFILVVAHSKKILDICNRVYVIKDKKIENYNE